MGSTPGTKPDSHDDLHNPDVAHEEKDVSITGVMWFVVALVGTAAAIHLSMYGLFNVFNRMEAASDPVVTPLLRPAGEPPPEPRLQTTPWQDLARFRANEERALHSFGWIDEKAGIAHVPIDKAKALLLQRGLPVRATPADPTKGTNVAASGDASGGRTIPAGAADMSTAQPAPAAPAQSPAAPAKPGAPAQTPTPPKGPGGGV
jgi:hypothetical protein